MKASVLCDLLKNVDPDVEVVFSVVDAEKKEFVIKYDYVGLTQFIYEKTDPKSNDKREYQILNLDVYKNSPIVGCTAPIKAEQDMISKLKETLLSLKLRINASLNGTPKFSKS